MIVIIVCVKVAFGDQIQGFEESTGTGYETTFLDVDRLIPRRLGARIQRSHG